MHTADIVLIGGGIVASSIAYHLVAAGCKNVLVIERETALGKGSTGKSMGGVRAQFSTPVNIQMSLYSIPFYSTFKDRLGYPCDYRPQGYLFCATNDKHMAYLRANYERQIAMGLKNVRLVDGDEIRSFFPQLRGDDIVGGSFCSTDGFVDPYSAMIGFMTWQAIMVPRSGRTRASLESFAKMRPSKSRPRVRRFPHARSSTAPEHGLRRSRR